MSQKNFTVDGGLEVYGGAVFNSDVNLNNNKVINVGTPVNAGDLVNKAYVDAITGASSESNPLSWTVIADKPTTIAGFGITDAFSGSWNDLTDVPDGVGGTIDWLNITNKPTFFSGRYVDLTGLPFIPTDINQLTDANNLLSVDTSAVVAKAGDTMTGTLNITGVANAIVAENDIRAASFLITGIGGLQTDGATDTVLFANNNFRLRAGGDQAADEVLNVNGTTGAVTISGLRYPTTDGTNGQVLGTNGSGVLSWVTSIAGSAYTDADVQSYLTGNVSGHIIPDTNVAYDLGSAEFKFRDLYLSSATIHLGDTKITEDTTTGSLMIKDANGNPRPIRAKALEIDDPDIDATEKTVMRKINGRMRFVHINKSTGAETIQDETVSSGGSADPATSQTAGTLIGTTTDTTFLNNDASHLVALGHEAQKNGGGGIAIGTEIGKYSPNTLTGNIAIGSQNLLMATTATANVTVGMNSLRNMTTGTQNMAIGTNTGYGMKHASRNTIIGYGAMPFYAAQVDGTQVDDNTAIGRASLNSVSGLEADGTTPRRTTGNIVVGNNGLYGLKGGRGNSSLGGGAAANLVYGDYNTFMGADAALTLTEGSHNIVIGRQAEPSSSTASNEITIGNATDTNRLRIPGVGLDTADAVDGKVLGWTGGAFAWVDAPAGSGGSASAATPTALGTVYGDTNTTTSTTSIGYNSNTGATNGVYIGHQAGQNATGDENVIIGKSAAANGLTGIYNAAFGHIAMHFSTSASYNTALGHNAAFNLTTGNCNTLVGDSVATGLTTGGYNTVVGRNAGPTEDAYENAAFGHSTLKLATGNRNTAIGHASLPALVVGNDNVALGKNAGNAFTQGDLNMFLGKSAGKLQTTGYNNMIIGQESDGIPGANHLIYLGNASHNRLVIPGLGLDTNDAADGDCLIWNDTTGEFVWGNPVTGSTGNLEANNFTVTGEVNISTEGAFQVNNATNKVWDVSSNGTDALAGVFSKNYHDHARFLINYESVTEERLSLTDWTTWTAVNVQQDLFAGHQYYTNKLVADVSNNIAGTRWTFQGNMLPYSYINNLILGTRYSAETRYYDVLVESSSDGVTWTTRHESTGNNLRAAVGVYGISSIGGNKWVRVTITLTNDATNDFTKDLEIRLGSVQLMSPRPGDQGSGSELEIPYRWTGDRKINFQNDIIMNGGGQILAEGNPNDGDNVPTAPAYAFDTEPDTGMFLETWDTIGFATGGVRRMKIGSGGAYVTNDNGVSWEQLLNATQLSTAEIAMKRLRVTENAGRTPGRTSAGVHGIQVGTDDNYHMEIDNNEICVLDSSGNAHNLILQREGGNLQMFSDTGSSNVLQFQPGRIQIGGHNVLTANDGVISDTNRVLTGDFSISKTSGAAVLYMDSGSNDSARLYVDAGNMYLQVAAADTGRTSGGGNLKFTGFNGTGLASATLNLNGVGDGHILTHTNIGNYNIDADSVGGKTVSDLISLHDVDTSDAPLVNFGRNIVKNAVISATPESDMTFIAGFHNDWAFARLRGATITVSGTVATTPSNSNIDAWFDAKASTSTVTVGATEADATVIEITGLPKNLNYSSWVGIAFGAHWNRCKGVKIETYSSTNAAWATQFYTNTNNSEMITTPATAGFSGSRGINGIRISLWNGQATSNTQCRLANIFGWDYSAELGTAMYVDRSGGTVYGTITQTSDARIKTDVVTIENALDKVNAMRGVTFTNTLTGETNQVGVIAQEMEAVIPELVKTDEETDQKSVAYANTVAVLIEAVKELTAKVEAQQAEIDALKGV